MRCVLRLKWTMLVAIMLLIIPYDCVSDLVPIGVGAKFLSIVVAIRPIRGAALTRIALVV